MKLGVKSYDPTVRVIQEVVPPFGGQPPDLLRQDLLGFMCEQVRHRGWFRDHIRHASLEQRILDEAGNTVGRVSEQHLRRRPQLEFVVSREGLFRGAVFDCNDVKVVEFIASDELRVRRRIVFDDDYVSSGRRLEVVDGAGKHVGALVSEEYGGRGTIEGRSRQFIGATRQVPAGDGVTTRSRTQAGRRSAGSRPREHTPNALPLEVSQCRRAALSCDGRSIRSFAGGTSSRSPPTLRTTSAS